MKFARLLPILLLNDHNRGVYPSQFDHKIIFIIFVLVVKAFFINTRGQSDLCIFASYMNVVITVNLNFV